MSPTPSSPRSAWPREGEALDRELDRAGALDVLLVLDNAEHVLDAAADVVARAVGRGDALRVLATSRERLGVDGEHVGRLRRSRPDTSGAPGPPAPRATGRGGRTRPGRRASTTSSSQRVVTRLDGLPLAIEMAAAELSTMSLAELDAELGQFGSVVRAMRSPHRNAPSDNRRSPAVLEWSEARLDDDERATLAGLSVFAGSFTADDAVAVLGQPGVAKTLRSLVDRSLVRIDRTRSGTRYALLQTVREFAAERLPSARQAPDLARRHALRFWRSPSTQIGSCATAEEAMAWRRSRRRSPTCGSRISGPGTTTRRWPGGCRPRSISTRTGGSSTSRSRWAELTIPLVSEMTPLDRCCSRRPRRAR